MKSSVLRMPLELLKNTELSISAKVVYTYMLWRFKHSVPQQGYYSESQADIAGACDMSRKTVNESIQKLMQIKWLSQTKFERQSSFYEVEDVFSLY